MATAATATAKANGAAPPKVAKDKGGKRSPAAADVAVGWSVIQAAQKQLGMNVSELCLALGYKSTNALAPYIKRGTAPLAVGLAVEGLVARHASGSKNRPAVFAVTMPAAQAETLEHIGKPLGWIVRRIV